MPAPNAWKLGATEEVAATAEAARAGGATRWATAEVTAAERVGATEEMAATAEMAGRGSDSRYDAFLVVVNSRGSSPPLARAGGLLQAFVCLGFFHSSRACPLLAASTIRCARHAPPERAYDPLRV